MMVREGFAAGPDRLSAWLARADRRPAQVVTMESFETDILILGAGGAGLCAALHAADRARVPAEQRAFRARGISSCTMCEGRLAWTERRRAC